MNISQTLMQAAASFALVKVCLEGLGWVLTDEKDTLYRAQLDRVFDVLDRLTLYDLTRHIAKRVISRLRLFQGYLPTWQLVITLALALLLNFVALELSFAYMARNNPNFLLEGFTLRQTAWALFTEQGFTGSQQIVLMSLFNTFWTLLAFSMSRRILSRVINADRVGPLTLFIALQLGLFVLTFLAMYASLYLSVWAYDRWSNTETQQYLLTQSIEMLNSFDRRLVAILLTNTIVSCTPSALFILLLVSLMAARIAPERVRRGLRYVVYRITTDKEPVLSQLATLSGGLVACATAIHGIIGKS